MGNGGGRFLSRTNVAWNKKDLVDVVFTVCKEINP